MNKNFCQNYVRSKNLLDFCSFPSKPIQLLHEHLKKMDYDCSDEQVMSLLSRDYLKAYKDGRLKETENKISFSSSFPCTNGDNVTITLKRSSDLKTSLPFFLYFVDTHEDAGVSFDPNRCLEDFAFLGDQSLLLADLKELAKDEIWDFSTTQRSDHILFQYVHYTFYLAFRQNKIAYAADNSLAAVNTGLINDRYEDIYICFTPNQQQGVSPWRYAGVCTSASGQIGKRLVAKLKHLPQRVSYLKSGDDILFDTAKEVMLDFEHIIVDNISRFPVSYLKSKLQLFECSDAVLDEHGNINFDKLKNELKRNSVFFISIKSDISCAMSLALTLIKNDYKVAIPIFYPREEMISLLLPLYLTQQEIPDVAVVVTKTESGNYQGHTVLTLTQAYVDARLVCAQPGSWLTADKLVSHLAT